MLNCLLLGNLLDHFALVVYLFLISRSSPHKIGLSNKALYVAGSLRLLHDWRRKVRVQPSQYCQPFLGLLMLLYVDVSVRLIPLCRQIEVHLVTASSSNAYLAISLAFWNEKALFEGCRDVLLLVFILGQIVQVIILTVKTRNPTQINAVGELGSALLGYAGRSRR